MRTSRQHHGAEKAPSLSGLNVKHGILQSAGRLATCRWTNLSRNIPGMHPSAPRRDIRIEHLSTSVEAGYILVNIAAASLAENVGVVCRRANGDGSRRSAPQITQVVGDALEFVRTQLHLIKKYHVVRGFRLVLWLAFIFGEGRYHLRFLVEPREPGGRSHGPSPL